MSLKFTLDKFGNRSYVQANQPAEVDVLGNLVFLYATASAQTITNAGGIDGGAAVGSPALRQTISPAGIATTQALGTPALRMTISPAGVATTSAVGTPALRMTIGPTGVASTEAVGSPTIAIVSAGQTITDAGGADGGAAVGSPALRQSISPASADGAAAVGTPVLRQTISPLGVAGADAVGEPIVILVGPTQTITDAGGIASSEAVGEPTLTTAKPQPISTGSPRTRRRGKSPYFIDRSRAQEVMAPTVLSPAGVESDSAVGTPALIMMVSPAGADGDAYVGTPTVSFDYRRRNKRELELLLFEAA
jgi:hypothetical protein